MKTDAQKLIKKHQNLTHSEMLKVVSHTQRIDGIWHVNTLMIEDCDAPFQYKRQQAYKSLKGARVNLTYYPETAKIGGFEMEIMQVVRIKVA